MQLFRNIQQELIKRIEESENSIKIAVTWFTNHDLYHALIKKLSNPNFELQLIVLNDRINNKVQGVNFQKFIDLNAKFYFSSIENMVHHKFCIIDNKTVITGSYNWTYYAENRNWENVLIIEDSTVSKSYINEFDRIIQSHVKVDNVSSVQQDSVSINSNEYLQTDYIFQAKNEEQKGNDLNVGRIYSELLKFNAKQQNLIDAREKILQKYNVENFDVAPFEIGILYKNGYALAIPVFQELPFSITKTGKTPLPGISALQVTIQKNDVIKKNILQFTMENLKVTPEGTLKLEHNLTLEKSGILTVVTNELNGYGKTKSHRINIKNCL